MSPTTKHTEQALEAILEVAPDLSLEDLEPSVDLHGDLGLDSIDLLNIASAIGQRTGIEIPESEYSAFRTVADIIGSVERRSNEDS